MPDEELITDKNKMSHGEGKHLNLKSRSRWPMYVRDDLFKQNSLICKYEQIWNPRVDKCTVWSPETWLSMIKLISQGTICTV